MGNSNQISNKDSTFHLPAYFLARYAFVLTHIDFMLWLNFLLNDPFDLGGNTLDYKIIRPKGECNPWIEENVLHNIMLFGLWWGTHSIFACKLYKETVGLWKHPVERPLFAAIAATIWGINILFWKPITDCNRWYPFNIRLFVWAICGSLIVLGALLLVGFLWILPDHVFGTSKYKYRKGYLGKNDIIRGFPYGLVRHPAATAFLVMYWSLPAYTPNHIFLASLWTVFIVIGTLVFEEGRLKGDDELGKKYHQYSKEVAAFYPTATALQTFLCPYKPKHQ